MNMKRFFLYAVFSGGKINKLVDPSTVRIPKVKRRKPLRPAKKDREQQKTWKLRERSDSDFCRVVQSSHKIFKCCYCFGISEFSCLIFFIFFFCRKKMIWMGCKIIILMRLMDPDKSAASKIRNNSIFAQLFHQSISVRSEHEIN